MILPHREKWPEINETAFVAPSADVIGRVKIGKNSSVWFQCVVRGDVNTIEIGDRTNIQDHSMLHVTRDIAPLKIGNDVTVGHRVTLHGCTIGDRVLVGMGAVVLDHAKVGDDSVVGAGSLLTQGKEFPSGSLILGSPAKVVRALSKEEIEKIRESAENYVGDSKEYSSFLRGPEILGNNDQDLEEFDEEGY